MPRFFEATAREIDRGGFPVLRRLSNYLRTERQRDIGDFVITRNDVRSRQTARQHHLFEHVTEHRLGDHFPLRRGK